MTNRTCIVVLGMHRSGTSAATRTIGLLGAQLPQDPLDPADDNPRGFWESRQLAVLHQNLLRELGSSWSDWRPLPIETLSEERARYWQNEIQATLTEQFGVADLFVVKEPRICRFVPFFLQALDTLGATPRIYIPFRHPLDVARSLSKRNGFALEKGILLWLRHVLDAEAMTREVPRAFCCYDRLLSDWRGAMSSAADRLGICWPRDFYDASEEIDSFLSPSLRHHANEGTSGDDADAMPWARDTFMALCRLEESPGAPEAVATLSRIRQEFEASASLFGVASLELSDGLAKLRQEKDEAEQRILALLDTKTKLEHHLAALDQKSRSIMWLLKRTRKVVSARIRFSDVKEDALFEQNFH